MTSKICTANAAKKRAQLHPFSCPKARPHREELLCKKLGRLLLPEEVLGMPEGVKVFAEWSLATKLSGRDRNRGAQEEGWTGKACKTGRSLLVSLFFY